MKTTNLKITFEMTPAQAAEAATNGGADPESECHWQAIHDATKASRHKILVKGCDQIQVLDNMARNGYRVVEIELV